MAGSARTRLFVLLSLVVASERTYETVTRLETPILESTELTLALVVGALVASLLVWIGVNEDDLRSDPRGATALWGIGMLSFVGLGLLAYYLLHRQMTEGYSMGTFQYLIFAVVAFAMLYWVMDPQLLRESDIGLARWTTGVLSWIVLMACPALAVSGFDLWGATPGSTWLLASFVGCGIAGFALAAPIQARRIDNGDVPTAVVIVGIFDLVLLASHFLGLVDPAATITGIELGILASLYFGSLLGLVVINAFERGEASFSRGLRWVGLAIVVVFAGAAWIVAAEISVFGPPPVDRIEIAGIPIMWAGVLLYGKRAFLGPPPRSPRESIPT